MSNVQWISKVDCSYLLPINTTNRYKDTLDVFSLYGLSQFNSLKNINEKTLDLVLCNKNLVTNLCWAAPLVHEDVHHKAVEFTLSLRALKGLRGNNNLSRNFKITNYNLVNLKVQSINWTELFKNCINIDYCLDVFYNQLNKIINQHVPARKINNDFPQYFTYNTTKYIKLKNKQHKKWKKSNFQNDYNLYCGLRTLTKILIRKDYTTYIKSMENEIPNNSKQFWRFVSTKNKNSSIPNIMYHKNDSAEGSDICNLFAKYFGQAFQPYDQVYYKSHNLNNYSNQNFVITEEEIFTAMSNLDENKGGGPDGIPSLFVKRCAETLCVPLMLLYNRSLKDCTFPRLWKRAYVVPIFKSGDFNCVTNYRPISKLDIFSKVFESIIHKFLLNNIKSQIILEQHGFFPKRSVESNLVDYSNYILNSMDQQIQVDSVYTDFSKAFDKISHNILIAKLAEVGVHGDLLRWLTSYIFNRTQIVNVCGHFSEPFTASSGVPQGSHLGPLLFLIYVNDIISCFRHCRFSLYADDLKLYYQIGNITDCYLVQNDLNRLCDYCERNKLVLNTEKCNFISFTRNCHIFEYDYTLKAEKIKNVDHIKDLGIIFDRKMTFSQHVENVVSKANRMLGFILRQCKEFKSVLAMKMLYYAFIHSRLNYASVVWNPQYIVYINRLEIVQNNFLRFLHFKTTGTYNNVISTSFLRRTYNFYSLESRRKQTDVMFLFKILNNLIDSPFLLSNIYFNVQRRNLREHPLFFVQFSRTNLGKNAPLNRIVHLYNSRYANVDLFGTSLNHFKNIIKLLHDHA